MIGEPKRILIWLQNWRGDVLFSTPFIKAIRKRYKDSHIAVIVNSRCREILEDNKYINEIVIYDDKIQERSIIGKIRFIISLKNKKFDTIFLLHRSLSRAMIACMAGVKERIGYFYKKRNFMLTKIIEQPTEPLHKIEYFLNIASHAGSDISDKSLDFFVNEEDRSYIDELLRRNGVNKGDPFIVINPGGNWPAKRWQEEDFAELSDRLIKKYNMKIVISGSENDVSRALRIQELAQEMLTIICGKTTLKQLGALFEKARIAISGDSGPLHIALAVGTGVIALFGPTSPTLTGPYAGGNYSVIQKDVGCQIPCYDDLCKDNRCMKAISVDDVMEKIKTFI